jgi:glyoxylase-like metal-dependent hydrolase (beta-lactamase superfamily II)
MKRRSALQLGLTALVGASLPRALHAETPAVPAAPSSPTFFKFAVGDFEAISLYDGTHVMPEFYPTWAPEAKKEEVIAALEHQFLPTDRLYIPFNALVIRTGKDVVLLDSGNGSKARPKLGQVESALAAAGLKPTDITAVFLSHAHADHIGGLLDGSGKPAFPNAPVYTTETESSFWLSSSPDLSKSALPSDAKKGMIAGAQQALDALKSQIKKVKSGDVIVPGLTVQAAPGHTPGHATVKIISSSQELLFLADTAHHPAIMFTNPDWTVAFDANPRLAAETRKKTFSAVATARTRVHLFHMPFPGVGHIRKGPGVSYEWVPEPWNLSQA